MKIIFTDLDESLLKENVYYNEILHKFIKNFIKNLYYNCINK